MRLISKGPEPKILTEFRAAGGTYAELSAANGKNEIKQQLLKEQNNCCAYCTGRLKLVNTKLEHWQPQSPPPLDRSLPTPPDLSLRYENMLGVCPGILYGGEVFHCDTSKGNTIITLNPPRDDHIASLSYSYGTGKIKSADPIIQADLDETDRLNLNCLEFKRRRQTAIEQLKTSLSVDQKNGKAPNFSKLLKTYSEKQRPFEDIVIAYLKKQVNRKR